MTSCAQTTTSGGFPAWLAVLNFGTMSLAMLSTLTVTPFSVAHCWARGVIAAARFWSAQMRSVAPLFAAPLAPALAPALASALAPALAELLASALAAVLGAAALAAAL